MKLVRLLRMLKALPVLALGATALPVTAGDVALVLVNGQYRQLEDPRVPDVARFYTRVLENAGFDVIEGTDRTAPEMRRLAAEFSRALEEDAANRVVIMLGGHMVRGSADTFLLGRDALLDGPFGLAAEGLPLGALTAVLETAQGKALVLMAEPDRPLDPVAGLQIGTDGVTAPQGVTLARGGARPLLSLLRDTLLDDGATYAAAARLAPGGVALSGFVSPHYGLAGAGGTPQDDDTTSGIDTGELAYWNAVRDIGTIDALEAYLRRYPSGRFVTEARRQVRDLREAPLRDAQSAETALNLGRDDRRQVQRNLSLLDFNPRGIDGIFGPGSRAAIKDWQADRGFDATTYLTRAQVTQLQQEADRRAAALEEEARRRRAAEERRDRAFWSDLGDPKSEDSLRAYLERYPDGVFADQAQARLDEIEAERRRQANAELRRAWEDTRARDTIPAYRQFLEAYPRSPFADTAQARLEELQDNARGSGARDAARAEEERIVGNSVTRLLVERRLSQLGLDPGPVDGNLDRQARRAIRRFQRDQGVDPTGFVTQQTMVLMLAVGR
ncbi:peptidoglycan-binding protein [Pseudooceanicola aestuarii]|uniref:peptidoglycan-binding protein n=1 Tax=Pseudooceanicola aestuarii TaxID=2697319 RepID=UPI0013D3CA9C|nr:peptidoglycan-binding protein [Pseudooceanicola aestuarii]